MQFEVPQFIEVEDKIIGPLTWRQFVYVSGGIGIAVVMFLTLPFLVFVLFGVPVGALAMALSFYPVNNRPFSYFLESFINYTTRPKRYHWRKEGTYVHTGSDEVVAGMSTQTPIVKPSTKDITSLARKLELEAMQKGL
jgi:hypothetical protein